MTTPRPDERGASVSIKDVCLGAYSINFSPTTPATMRLNLRKSNRTAGFPKHLNSEKRHADDADAGPDRVC